MCRRVMFLPLFLLTGALLSTSTMLAGRVDRDSDDDRDFKKGRPGGNPCRIVNHVVDLLEEEILLQSDGDNQAWESEVFNTAQFTRIGLKISGEVERGQIRCSVAWQFTPDDEFQATIPSAWIGRYAESDYGPRVDPPLVEDPADSGPVAPDGPEVDEAGDMIQRPDGIPDLYVMDPRRIVSVPPLHFTGIYGLRARVSCQIYGGLRYLGDDQSLEPDPEPALGALTDVKVLLRRE